MPLAHAGGESAAEQWEPVISPLLLQACWQQLEAAWTDSRAISGKALRHYVSSGALAVPAEVPTAAAEVVAAAGMLGSYLQLHGVPMAGVLQQTARQVQDMLGEAQLPNAAAARAAAAAMLASVAPGMGLPAAQAIAAALLH